MSNLDPLSWNWATIISTFVSAGAGTAFFAWLRDYFQNKQRAAYLALDIALTLEGFAGHCAELVEENKNALEGPDDQFPNWNSRLPALAEISPDPEGWRCLPRAMAAAIKGLSPRIAESNSLIGSACEHLEHELDLHVQQEAALRGLDALDVAGALRRRYALGHRLSGLGLEDSLLRALLEARGALAQRREKSRKFWDSLSPTVSVRP